MTAPEVTVLGAGAWGQALALHLARTGHRVVLQARRPAAVFETAEPPRRSRRLAGTVLPHAIRVAGAIPAGTTRAVVVAVPVQHLRAALAALVEADPGGRAPLVLACKGVETASGALPVELAAALLPERIAAVLGGPNFAHEIAAGLPAAATLAARPEADAVALARLFGAGAFRVYPSDDPIGCALAGAAKNVIAIAAGVAIGAALGENARAALVTRGLAEIARLVRAEGGRAETVFGLAGAGDLLLTCTGGASRNFRVGLRLGRGEPVDTVLARRDDGTEGVAEGIATAPALLARAVRHGVELPIAAAIAALLAGRSSVLSAAQDLLARPTHAE